MMISVFDGLLFSQRWSKVLINEIIQGACFYGSQAVQLSEVPPYQMSLNQQTNTDNGAEVHTVDTHSHVHSHTRGTACAM